MPKEIFIALVVMACTGCSGTDAFTDPALSNEQIIAEKSKCEAAGMGYVLAGIDAPYEITRVTCTYPGRSAEK